MQKLILSLSALALLSGCIGENLNNPSALDRPDIRALRENQLRCAQKVIPKIDDGVSSAEVVASTIPSFCAKETSDLIDAMRGSADYKSTWNEHAKYLLSGKNFTGIVLASRASKEPTKVEIRAKNKATNEMASARYSDCLHTIGRAWCSAGAGIDLVERSFSDSCKEERRLDEADLLKKYKNNRALTELQKKELVSAILSGDKKWALEAYRQGCKAAN